MAQLAGDTNVAAVGSNNRLGDREAHASTANEIALVAAAVELVKNKALLKGIDARAMIGNTES